MGYPDQLLATSNLLLYAEPTTQANIRRAVSSAYYALFHLLIESACQLWAQPDHHPRLARQFEHKRMKEASVVVIRATRDNSSESNKSLAIVAELFIQLQQDRHRADYDLGFTLSKQQSVSLVSMAETACKLWNEMKNDPIAHDYLFSLLFRERA